MEPHRGPGPGTSGRRPSSITSNSERSICWLIVLIQLEWVTAFGKNEFLGRLVFGPFYEEAQTPSFGTRSLSVRLLASIGERIHRNH
jgi:hypothetical protein